MAVTAVWGGTFVMVKEAVASFPLNEFLAIRFAVGTLVLAIAFPRKTIEVGRAVMPCALLGVTLAVGYFFQTAGLKHTTATNAAFVTGLFVVFAPLVAAVFFKKLPHGSALAGVALAAIGLLLLVTGPSLAFNRGDLLVLVCAVSFAAQIVGLGYFAPRIDARTLAVGQLATVAVLLAIATLATETLVAPSASVWVAIVFTGIAASAVAFLVQSWAQSMIPPTRAAVILTMEPVFAGIFGAVFLGERLSLRGSIGALLILSAMLLVSVRGPERDEV